MSFIGCLPVSLFVAVCRNWVGNGEASQAHELYEAGGPHAFGELEVRRGARSFAGGCSNQPYSDA